MASKNRLRYLLSATLLVLAGAIYALNYSYTFESKKWDGWGTQNLDGIDWTLQGTNAAHFGYDGTETDRGQQFGSEKNPNDWISIKTSDFEGKITTVKVEASGAKGVIASLQVKVGGVLFFPVSASLSKANVEYEFTGDATGELEIYIQSAAKTALYIKKISVEYSGEINPTIVVEEISLDFECDYDATHEREIEVEAYDLVADIQANITGINQDKFYYSFSESFNYRTGGVILVGYNPNLEEDIHVASLVVSSAGATPKEIELNGVSRAISSIDFPEDNPRVWTEKNKINFYASEGDVVELVTLTGQTVLQTTANEGLNAIHLQAQGILIIKIANKASKIIM